MYKELPQRISNLQQRSQWANRELGFYCELTAMCNRALHRCDMLKSTSLLRYALRCVSTERAKINACNWSKLLY